MQNGGDSKYNNGKHKRDDLRNMPFFSGLIRKVYLALPRSKSFDVSMSVASLMFFQVVRFMSDSLFTVGLEWEETHLFTRECASFVPPIVMAFILLLCLGELLWAVKYVPTSKMKDAPFWWQQCTIACLEFCTGYMLYDSIYVCWDAAKYGESLGMGQIMFLGHHLTCALYMTSVRYLGAGQLSAMMLMFQGEFTNPVQSTYSIVRYAIHMEPQRQLWQTLLPYCELFFACLYAVFRTFVGPFTMVHITYHLYFTKQGRDNVPISFAIAWTFLGWAVLIGSYGWTVEAIEMALDGWTVKYNSSYDYGPAYKV